MRIYEKYLEITKVLQYRLNKMKKGISRNSNLKGDI
jgi:hypothetical protein